MVRLFIENEELELTENVQVAITKQFEDLSDPTTIINEWSKTVSIPFTVKNNNIFGHIYSPDKVIVDGGSVGIYFNPLKKLDFRLEWDSCIIMIGYAKLNEVKQVAGKGTYELTLFGQLGKVFQEMKKITFDTSTTETEYLINGSQYVEEYINKDLVHSSWQSTGQAHSNLLKKGQTGYKVTDIIGFAPNNSYSEGFKYDSYQPDSNSSKQFVETLGDAFTNATGINPDTVIPNGMLPREIGEYRSYLQLPYIYWNKLFQIFQEKAEAITGYQFELDDSWFNTANPYWYNLVYMLKNLNLKQEESATNYYKFAAFGLSWGGDMSQYVISQQNDLLLRKEQEIIPVVDSNDLYIDLSNNYNIVFNTIFTIDFDVSNYNNLRINPDNGLQFSIAVCDENSTQLEEHKYLLVDSDYVGNVNGYEEVIKVFREGSGGWTVYPHLSMTLNKGKLHRDKVKLVFKAVWLNTGYPFLDSYNNPFKPTPTQYHGYVGLHIYSVPTNNPLPVILIKNVHRSYGYFMLNDLWNNDYNLFEEIIKYCKMYRISISVDSINKKIIFKPYFRLFDNYSVVDWTNKIDKSKDFIITPVTLENKYILFNYENNKTKIGEEYKNKFGVNYGEYRLLTDYNFNIETKNLFNKVHTSIVNTDNVLSWTNLNDNHKIVYSFPSEISVYNKDKENKQVDVFGSYYFHNGTALFSTEQRLYMRDVTISDDTTFQQANDTYMYTQNAGLRVKSLLYPKLDIVRGNNICLFNIPSENFTYINNYSGKNSIYDNLWKPYLDERYNIQNKKITCYVDIKPYEYNQFQWNKLVMIGNQLCVVNKIYDYDVTANDVTKVDLITIQDINGYKDDTFFLSIDDLVLHFSPTSYFSGNIMTQPSQVGTFDTASNVTFANGTTAYTTNGVMFTISGNTVYHKNISTYLDKEDADFYVTLKNAHHTDSFHCVRYATYPYPEIKLYESDGTTERSTIYPGSRNYKLAWYGTETYGLENKPTVTIEIHGTGSASIVANTWTENEVMIQTGDGDEYFRNEYMVNFNTNMVNYSGSYVRVTIVDVEGWHDTRDFPVSL